MWSFSFARFPIWVSGATNYYSKGNGPLLKQFQKEIKRKAMRPLYGCVAALWDSLRSMVNPREIFARPSAREFPVEPRLHSLYLLVGWICTRDAMELMELNVEWVSLEAKCVLDTMKKVLL